MEPPTAQRKVDPELVRRASSPSIAPPPLPKTVIPPAMRPPAAQEPPAPRRTVERDASGVPGPLEAALVGVAVTGPGALAVQHVVRSFDPCMVCTVH